MDPLSNLAFTTSGALIDCVDSTFPSPAFPRSNGVEPAKSHVVISPFLLCRESIGSSEGWEESLGSVEIL